MKPAIRKNNIRSFMNRTRIRRLLSKLVLFGLMAFVLLKIAVWISPISKERLSGYAESVRIFDKNGILLRESVNIEGARAQWVSIDQIFRQADSGYPGSRGQAILSAWRHRLLRHNASLQTAFFQSADCIGSFYHQHAARPYFVWTFARLAQQNCPGI